MTALADEPVVPPAVRSDLLTLPAPKTAHGRSKLLMDVARAGPNLVAVGELGLILRSADAGRTWTQMSSPTSVMLTAVSFADERKGWAVGHDGVVLASSDGGEHWLRQLDGGQVNLQMLKAAQSRVLELASTTDVKLERQREQAQDRLADAKAAVKAGPSRPLFAVRFIDAQIGFSVGSFGQVLHTTDAGRTWRYIGDRLPNPEGLHLNSMTLAPWGSLYIAAEAGVVFQSRDQGITWSRHDLGYAGHLYGVVALGSMGQGQILIAFGFAGHMFRSQDAGSTWIAVPSPTRRTIVTGSAAGDARVLLGTEDGRLLVSHDSGRAFSLHWQYVAYAQLSAFAFESGARALVAAGAGGISTTKLDLPGERP